MRISTRFFYSDLIPNESIDNTDENGIRSSLTAHLVSHFIFSVLITYSLTARLCCHYYSSSVCIVLDIE